MTSTCVEKIRDVPIGIMVILHILRGIWIPSNNAIRHANLYQPCFHLAKIPPDGVIQIDVIQRDVIVCAKHPVNGENVHIYEMVVTIFTVIAVSKVFCIYLHRVFTKTGHIS